jgi:hypothetical protein
MSVFATISAPCSTKCSDHRSTLGLNRPHNATRARRQGCDVTSLEAIAKYARHCKVRSTRPTTVLFADHMVDVTAQCGVVAMNQAILAERVRSLLDLAPKPSGKAARHRRRGIGRGLSPVLRHVRAAENGPARISHSPKVWPLSPAESDRRRDPVLIGTTGTAPPPSGPGPAAIKSTSSS